MSKADITVILHGGALGREDAPTNAKRLPVLKEALDAAWDSLAHGHPGERAVVAALNVMEGNEYFNAGYGSFPNEDGRVYMDVALMRGSGDFISLMHVERLKYPSSLALELFPSGTMFSRTNTAELDRYLESASTQKKGEFGYVSDQSQMLAPHAVACMEHYRAMKRKAEGHDTVGCVVRDAEGRLFAGTSTGGTGLKADGRVGDSPIIGAGIYADNDICALSATGHGESILRSLLSGHVVSAIRQELRTDQSVFETKPEYLTSIIQGELSEMKNKCPTSAAGLIVIPAFGPPAYAFNSWGLGVAWRCGGSFDSFKEGVSIEHH